MLKPSYNTNANLKKTIENSTQEQRTVSKIVTICSFFELY